MKKAILIISLLLSLYNSKVFSQQVNVKKNQLPNESIFVHYNTSLLFSGETLYYSIFCLNSSTLSSLSKIAYVELIDQDKNVVFKHKIRLENGLGQGDFFINTNIPSGNYKIVSYTQLMRNFDFKNFFQEDLVIINPFQKNPIKNNDSIIKNEFSTAVKHNKKSLNYKQNNKYLKLNLPKKRFSKRNKVSLNLEGLLNEDSYGSYSISVRKKDTLKKPERQKSIGYIKKSQQSNYSTIRNDKLTFMPELRGQLFSGEIISNNKSLDIARKQIILTIPDQSNIIKVITTDNSGVFNFNIEKEYQNSNAIVQVFGHKKGDYTINLNDKSQLDYDSIKFYDFQVTSEMETYILEKSINSQIENAYSSIKADSIYPIKPSHLFYKNFDIEYILDDYKRFPTLKETVIEVIDNVWFSQKKDQYTLHVRGRKNINRDYQLPLVLVDGIPFQNHNALLDFNANKIKSIQVVRDEYIYGSMIFSGIIAIETTDEIYTKNFLEEYIEVLNLSVTKKKKDYFNQLYNNASKYKRIPDYRYQLYWNPNLIIKSRNKNITFYTSDISGEFEISIEGFTNSGEPISIYESFIVGK